MHIGIYTDNKELVHLMHLDQRRWKGQLLCEVIYED